MHEEPRSLLRSWQLPCSVAALLGVLLCGGGVWVVRRNYTAPARKHFAAADREALLAGCRALMDDPSAHGSYADAARLARALKGPYVESGDGERRALDSLPPALSDLEPVEVVVRQGSLALSWPGHGYGYLLIVLRDPDGVDAQTLRTHDGEYNRAVELEPGVWSYFMFH